MKRFFAGLTVFVILLSFFGCAQHTQDYFDLFRSPYRAELCGNVRGVSFSAELVSEAATAQGQAMRLSFFEPQGLAGLVLLRAQDGTVTALAGEQTFSDAVLGDLAAFFSFFPTKGEVAAVELDENGHTVLRGEGFAIRFLKDGTPVACEIATGYAQVVQFSALEP